VLILVCSLVRAVEASTFVVDNTLDPVKRRLDEQAIIDSGLAPTEERESALLATLAPGAYTAIVRGVNNTTGVGLVEIYNLQ
jgi:hypothetical protein